MESNTSTPSLSDTEMADQANIIKGPPALFKTYVDDPKISDITINLKDDRTVLLHKIVLCRGSEYFSNLFAKSPQDELELLDDEPEAMMAVLRHIYGLPYPSSSAELDETSSLLPHALVYVTAEKYQIHALKIESCSAMSDILLKNSKPKEHALEWLCSPDQLRALREIIIGTPASNTAGRNLLVTHRTHLMPGLNNNQAFMELVADLPGLGADLITNIYNGKDHDSDADYASAQDVSEDEESEDEDSEIEREESEDAEIEDV
ncbi:hypothetical protein MBLNU13_g08446t1 [Cladosporium sp. NU13]